MTLTSLTSSSASGWDNASVAALSGPSRYLKSLVNSVGWLLSHEAGGKGFVIGVSGKYSSFKKMTFLDSKHTPQ